MNSRMSSEELRSLPAAIDLPTAGRALGIGRSKIYELARSGGLPQGISVILLGNQYRVVTADLLRVLKIED